MIVTIPVDGKSMSACINKSFGRTPYFLVYNTETQHKEFIDNAAAMSQGGAGIQASQFVVDQKTEVVIVPALGKNAADVLKGSGLKVYVASGCSIQDNIQALMDGKLETITKIHAGFHNHGR